MIKPRQKIAILVVSIMIILSLCSFFFTDYIRFVINHDRASEFELDFAYRNQLSAYHHHQRRNHIIGTREWLNSTVFLAKNDIDYVVELAQYYESIGSFENTEKWYLKAIEQHNLASVYQLARIYFHHNMMVKVEKLLTSNKVNDIQKLPIDILSLLLEASLVNNDLSKSERYYQLLKTQVSNSSLIKEIEHFSVFNVKGHIPAVCVASIQMFATNLADLRHVSKLIQHIEQHRLSEFVCFNEPRYIALEKLDCQHNEDESIRCNEFVWQEHLGDINSRYIGVLLPKGGANVNNGILYIDKEDTLKVFIHEITHLLGFIDEYPLPTNHAKCLSIQGAPFSHNVAVLPKYFMGDRDSVRQRVLKQLPWGSEIDPKTPILTSDNNGWKLGTPKEYKNEVGVFESQTCAGERSGVNQEEVEIKSFKPVSHLTQLNYFELELPKIYLKLLHKSPTKYLMPDFLINIEKAANN